MAANIPRMLTHPFRAAAAVVVALMFIGCHGAPETVGAVRLEILTPPDYFAFAGASFLRLTVDDASTGQEFEISPDAGIDVGLHLAADGAEHRVRIEGLDQNRIPIARGEAPPVRFEAGAEVVMRLVARPIGQFTLALTPLSEGRVDFALATVAGQGAYVIGGQAGGKAMSSVERIDLWTTQGIDAPSLPQPRRAPSALVTDDGTVLIVGGDAEAVVALSQGAESWTTLPSTGPSTRHPAVVAVGADTWLLLGGEIGDLGASDQTWTARWLGHDLKITAGAPLGQPLSRPVATRVGDHVFIGGASGALGEWLDGTQVAGPSLVGHAQVAVSDSVVLLAGGDDTRLRTVSREGGVVEHGELSLLRRFASADVSKDGRVIVIGGHDTASLSADIVALKDGTWTRVRTVLLTVRRARHLTTWLPGEALLAIGGVDHNGALVPRGDVFLP